MRTYEILLLTVPEITQDETKQLQSEIERLIRMVKGTVISFERWGKYALAYPVEKNDYGIYFLVRFEIEIGTTVIQDIKEYLIVKLSTVVMRSVFTVLESKASLEYQRPRSLEETPTSRDMGAFLKENKMEGFAATFEDKADGRAEMLNDLDQSELA